MSHHSPQIHQADAIAGDHTGRSVNTTGARHPSTRRKILLLAHDVTLAHLGRPLTLGHYLHEAGHEVILATSATSARFLQDFPGRTQALQPTGSARFMENLAHGRPAFDLPTLQGFVEEDEQLLSHYRPDLVIGDFRLSLSISARRQQVPFASISNAYWSPRLSPRFVVPELPMVKFLGPAVSQRLFDLARPFAFAHHSRPLNMLRRRYGLPSLGHDLRRIYTDADLLLYSDVPELYDDAAAGPASRFIGPLQWSPPMTLPDWWNEIDPDRPLIYLTLGSSGDKNALPETVRQLSESGAQIMVATLHPRQLSPLGRPPGLFCADYLPGALAAARADLVVCNGGSATAYQALAGATPVLGLPRNLDQFLNMQGLEAHGLGHSVRSDRLAGAGLGRLARQMLDDRALIERAARFAQTLARHDPRTHLPAILRTLCP